MVYSGTLRVEFLLILFQVNSQELFEGIATDCIATIAATHHTLSDVPF
jgi:hypothetical protein